MSTPTQAARLATLEASLATLLEENNRVIAANAALEERVTTLAQARASPPLTSTTSHEKTLEPKVASPEFFSGSRSGLTPFLTQVSLVMGLQPSRFSTERIKVLWTGSYLRGTALLWFQPHVGKTPEEPMMNDFSLFCKKLKELFGDPDEEASAERNLYALKQKGSATSYLTDFQRHAVLTKWNDQAKMAQFYRGLKEAVKDELARLDKPQDFMELVETAIKIDTRVYERALEKGSDTRVTTTPSTNVTRGFTPRTPATTPTSTYNTTNGQNGNQSAKPTTNLTRSGRIPSDEYKRRRDNNLCLYCASGDHAIINCPLSKPKDNTIKAAFTNTEDQVGNV
jgi:hypothetical protein